MKHRKPLMIFAAAALFVIVLAVCLLPALTGKRGPDPRRERLDRGLAAMCTENGVYLSWRLFFEEDPVFGSAGSRPRFTVLRDGEAIAELDGMTNFTDPAGSPDSFYAVQSSGGDKSAAVRPFASGKNYFDIPLVRPEDDPNWPFTINDVSTGDLDGDGALDLVIKWDSGGLDNSYTGYTGRTLLDALRLDGTQLWQKPIDLGPNIRSGPHYTQFLVYDLDRDGKSEIICKTAPGSRDAAGNYVSQAASSAEIRGVNDLEDLRNEDGFVLTGDEFLTVFRGETGEAADTIYYPNQRIASEVWGDTIGNRADRYTAAVAWLDGLKPYAVFMRGYYLSRNKDSQRQAACAVSFDGSRLRCGYSFDTYDVSGYQDKAGSSSYTASGKYKGTAGYHKGNEVYAGEGNHNCAAADVDGDGKDEVLTGALCYEADGGGKLAVKWCTFLGHGDALHIGDYDPVHPGLEFFTVHEDSGADQFTGKVRDYGFSVLDPADGSILFHHGSDEDTGRGMMANIGVGGYYQVWARMRDNDPEADEAFPGYRKTGSGYEEIFIPKKSSNFRIFWDGDLFDELLDGESGKPLTVTSWNGSAMEPVFRTEGAVSVNGSKANPCLQADILGDWREELVMAREDNGALRVFISDIPTDYAVMTLMHDPVYRAGVAAEQTGYNQPPHIGFYLSGEMFR